MYTCYKEGEKEPETKDRKGSPKLPTMARVRAIAKERAREQRRREGRGGEGCSRRGWKSVTERREARERRLEQERDRTRERGRGSTRRPRLRRSLSVGAVAGPSCPACAQVSVLSSPCFWSCRQSYGLCTIYRRRRHRRRHHLTLHLFRAITRPFSSVVSTVSYRASLSFSIPLSFSIISISLFLPLSRSSLLVESRIERIADERRPRIRWEPARRDVVRHPVKSSSRKTPLDFLARESASKIIRVTNDTRGARLQRSVSHKVYTTGVIVERYKLLGISNERRTSFTGQQRPGGSRWRGGSHAARASFPRGSQQDRSATVSLSFEAACSCSLLLR